MIAPVWVDIDYRAGGELYYRVTRNSSVLSELEEIVGSSLDGYSPLLAVVVTWNDSVLFRNSRKVNYSNDPYKRL